MKREMLDFSIKELNCVPNGTKEACLKVREFLQNIQKSNDGIRTYISCCVSDQEFIDSVKVLMAFAWQNKDKDCVPENWYCDVDCAHLSRCIFCSGEFQLAAKDENGKSLVKTRCPYFGDSSYK